MKEWIFSFLSVAIALALAGVTLVYVEKVKKQCPQTDHETKTLGMIVGYSSLATIILMAVLVVAMIFVGFSHATGTFQGSGARVQNLLNRIRLGPQ